MPAFTGKSKEEFVPTFITPDPGEACVQVSALQILDHDLPEMGTQEAEPLLKALFPKVLQDFPVILYALVERGQMGFSGTVNL